METTAIAVRNCALKMRVAAFGSAAFAAMASDKQGKLQLNIDTMFAHKGYPKWFHHGLIGVIADYLTNPSGLILPVYFSGYMPVYNHVGMIDTTCAFGTGVFGGWVYRTAANTIK